MLKVSIAVLVFALAPAHAGAAMRKVAEIRGAIAPKSVVHSGRGLFFAQNMMYRHSITVYDRDFDLVKTISDSVRLTPPGVDQGMGREVRLKGAPVEATFSHGGAVAWVSNYNMLGQGYRRPGNDVCNPKQNLDHSTVYRIDTKSLAITHAIPVGSVPKFLAATPDDRFVLVSNWCSWTLSVIATDANEVVATIPLGRYPRGIAVSPDSKTAYVALMGTQSVAAVDLVGQRVRERIQVGSSPRHVLIDEAGKNLYVSLNGAASVAKVDLASKKVTARAKTGAAPRSMIQNADGSVLYVVNYGSSSVSKITTADMCEKERVSVPTHPIGVTFDAETGRVWVSSYSGKITVFEDQATAAVVASPFHAWDVARTRRGG
jgi:YVTN family beta-propeller protein